MLIYADDILERPVTERTVMFLDDDNRHIGEIRGPVFITRIGKAAQGENICVSLTEKEISKLISHIRHSVRGSAPLLVVHI